MHLPCGLLVRVLPVPLGPVRLVEEETAPEEEELWGARKDLPCAAERMCQVSISASIDVRHNWSHTCVCQMAGLKSCVLVAQT